MSVEKFQKDIGKDLGDKKKNLHDYTGEELDKIHETDIEEWERLWSEAELEAINTKDNHEKSL